MRSTARVLGLVVTFLGFAHSLLAFQPGPVTIKAGRLLDGTGAISYETPIHISNGKIVSLGKDAGGQIVDLSDFTVLPGFIDTHDHFSWHFDPDGKLHDASREEESPAQEVLYALENAYRTLMAGVTTVQSLGAQVDRDVRDWIARGILPGPRVLTSQWMV